MYIETEDPTILFGTLLNLWLGFTMARTVVHLITQSG